MINRDHEKYYVLIEIRLQIIDVTGISNKSHLHARIFLLFIYYVLFYNFLSLAHILGSYTITKDCWRPLGKSTVSQLRRFFTGGTPELEDPTYVVAPATFEVCFMMENL